MNTPMKITVGIIGILTIVQMRLLYRHHNMVAERLQKFDTTVQILEGKISLHEGKALLSSGRTCLVNEEGLKSEDLAIGLVRACVQQYHNSQVL